MPTRQRRDRRSFGTYVAELCGIVLSGSDGFFDHFEITIASCEEWFELKPINRCRRDAPSIDPFYCVGLPSSESQERHAARRVCQTIVEERGEEVFVRVLVCRHDEDDGSVRRDMKYMDCPVRLWLDRPLGERAVIDLDTDEEVPLYTPLYMNNVPRRDHGYRPANRRL